LRNLKYRGIMNEPKSSRGMRRANSPPTDSPAEVLVISPEALEVANTYLTNQSLVKTAEELNIPAEDVSSYLSRKEVRAYIDNVFLDYGYNNQFKLANIMDAVISKKLQDMDEADIGSDKDITDIIALKHKMTIEIMDRQIKLETARAANIRNQTNVQINGGGSAYDMLLEKLVNNGR
jgi:hypothetical protein